MSMLSPRRAPRPFLSGTGRGVAVLLLAVPVMGIACGGDIVVLGNSAPRRYRFGPPQLIAELSGQAKDDNPTLTADLLEIFFTSDRGATSDVWTARRATPAQPFNAPEVVAAASSPGYETSPAISADGLTLWVGSDRMGGLGDVDVWMSSRPTRTGAWSDASPVVALNSPAKDVPRPPGQHELIMPLSSDRTVTTVYQTYFASRATPQVGFTKEPAFLSELALPGGASTVDAFLTDDGLTLFFTSSTASTLGDLFVAWRKSTTQPFANYLPLTDLNTAGGEERDPWLSPDGTQFYFVSDRSGSLDIYVSAVSRDPYPTSH